MKSARALILTYHDISTGPPPLCVSPSLLARHLDLITESGAQVLTITELAAALRDGRLPQLAVALTFDDGTAGAVRVAAPMLASRRLPGTIYCVAGYLGRPGRWPSLPARAMAFELAAAGELAAIATAGFEIGCHGFEHAPLHRVSQSALRRELSTARDLIENAVGVPVRSLAYPYNAVPGASGMTLVRTLFSAACAGSCRQVKNGDDPFALARVDAHYVRNPAVLRSVLNGRGDGYLTARRVAGQARRLVRKDFGT